MRTKLAVKCFGLLAVLTFLPLVSSVPAAQAEVFRLEEATIAGITAAFDAGAMSCRQLTQLYLNRIAAYDKNGPKINSIVGLRPTTGLVSRDGIAPKNLNFDSAGPLARTVTDVAVMLTAIAGPDPADPDGFSMDVFRKHPAGVGMNYTQFLRHGALKGARLGVARAYFGGDPEIDALANAAIAKMKELGAEIVDPIVIDPAIIL